MAHAHDTYRSGLWYATTVSLLHTKQARAPVTSHTPFGRIYNVLLQHSKKETFYEDIAQILQLVEGGFTA